MPLLPLLQSPLASLISSLIAYQPYSALFEHLPDKKLYADYYIFIKEPRSLSGIQVRVQRRCCLEMRCWASPGVGGVENCLPARTGRMRGPGGNGTAADTRRSLSSLQDSMKKGIYSSPSAVAYDLFLVWANAREYNEQGSQVYNDAEKLEVSLPVRL